MEYGGEAKGLKNGCARRRDGDKKCVQNLGGETSWTATTRNTVKEMGG